MQTYSYFDYGLEPAYQCSVDATDLNDANDQITALGLPLHRLTAVLGVRLQGELADGDLVYVVRQRDSHKDVLEAFLTLIKVHDVVDNCTRIVYQYPTSGQKSQVHEVVITDLLAEFLKHGIAKPPTSSPQETPQ